MIFPAQAGGMSSLVSLVPPSFGVKGPCAEHSRSLGCPGGQQAQQCWGGWAPSHQALGEMPAEPGNEGQRGREKGGLTDSVPGAPWLSLMDDSTYCTLGSHWAFPQPCSDIHAVGRWHSQGVDCPHLSQEAPWRHSPGAGGTAQVGWARDPPGPHRTE